MVWDLYCFCDHSKAVLVCASFMKKRKKVWLLPLFCQLFRWFKLKFWYEHDLTSFRAIYIACTFQLACCFEWRSVTSDWWWKYCFSPWSALRKNEISSLSFIINLFGFAFFSNIPSVASSDDLTWVDFKSTQLNNGLTSCKFKAGCFCTNFCIMSLPYYFYSDIYNTILFLKVHTDNLE